MTLTKQASFTKKPADLPDIPSSVYTPAEIKEFFETPHDELMTTVNTAIDTLNSTADGNSGANNIGATGFDGTPSNTQTMLEDLNTRKADKGTDWTGTWQGYTPSMADPGISAVVQQHTAQLAEKAKKSDLDASKINSKYMLVYFCDTAYRQDTDYFTSFATNGKNAGFKEINILLHINSDGTTTEDMTKFSQYSSIADSLGIPITCLKVHGTYSYPNYLTNVYNALAQLPHINTVFVFNEQFNSVYTNGLTYPSQIKTQYPNVTKVGCTVDYGTAFKTWLDSASNLTAIQNSYDVLGVHMYPSCGSFDEAKNTTYEKCLKAFNEFQLTIPWQKEIWLTESGVLPYWQFLELPESYNLTPLTDQTKTIDPQRLFYRALFNSNFANRVKVVIPWYTESWMDSNTLTMWDVMKNIIKNN